MRQPLPEDVTQLALRMRYARYDSFFDGADRVDALGGPRIDSTMAVLSVRHFLGDGWSVDGSLPMGMVRLDPEGDAPDRRLSGLGDVELGVAYDLAALWGTGGRLPSLTIRAGLGLPTGEQATLGADDPSVTPEVLALGLGTFSANLRADLTWPVHPELALTAPVGVRLPLTRSPNGVAFGTSVTYGLGLLWFPSDGVQLGARIRGLHRERSTEQTRGPIVSSGGDRLAAEALVGGEAAEGIHVGARLRAPFYTRVNGEQAAETATLSAHVAFRFGGEGDGAAPDHEHAHDGAEAAADEEAGGDPARGDPARGDSGEGDVRDVATGGATFALAEALAEGKVTVVDFWASWCEPCGVIDERLRALAAEHPDLAVRRAEVPSGSAPIAREQLGGNVELPLLWIHGPNGERLRTLRGAAPEEAVEAVEEALRGDEG